METNIELGDTVEDIYTGVKGVAVARTEFINGCVQFSVAQRLDKKNPPLGPELLDISIDSYSLKIIKKKPKPKIKKVKEDDYDNGGPSRRAVRQRGY